MISARKDELMHHVFGVMDGVKCKNCPHLEAHVNGDCTRVWYKCRIYGETCGPGTDWRVGYTACNGFRIPPEEAEAQNLYGSVYRLVRGLRMPVPREEIQGQIRMEECFA